MENSCSRFCTEPDPCGKLVHETHEPDENQMDAKRFIVLFSPWVSEIKAGLVARNCFFSCHSCVSWATPVKPLRLRSHGPAWPRTLRVLGFRSFFPTGGNACFTIVWRAVWQIVRGEMIKLERWRLRSRECTTAGSLSLQGEALYRDDGEFAAR